VNAPTDKSGGFGRLAPPVDRIAEILEALFVKEPALTAALLDELGRADTAMLAKLFGWPPTPADTLPAYGPVRSTRRLQSCSWPPRRRLQR
jgi:hypothetical protein